MSTSTLTKPTVTLALTHPLQVSRIRSALEISSRAWFLGMQKSTVDTASESGQQLLPSINSSDAKIKLLGIGGRVLPTNGIHMYHE
jgi:hypothetical protein